MRMDRRAIGGFMETMAAMMIVTVALSAFMTVLVYTSVQEEIHKEISTDFLGMLTVTDEGIVGIDDDFANDEAIRKGYASMTIYVSTAGDVDRHTLFVGTETDGKDQMIKNGNIMLYRSDGTRCAAVYEVIAFV